MPQLVDSAVITRDIEYTHDGTRMLGMVVAPEGARTLPAVVLIHDAFGLSEDMIAIARRLAGLGFAVFAADVWGERHTPTEQRAIGSLIGAMVSDRERWLARVAAAHGVAAAQPEVDGDALVSLGYCFGGASALEHARTGGKVRGVISIHGGLDLIEFDWSRAGTPHVLLCTGAHDPMATPEQLARLQQAMDGAGVDWEVDMYSGTVHAFTSLRSQNSPKPELFAYHPRSAARAWDTTTRFLRELFPAQ